MHRTIQPIVIGRGMAGQAIAQSLGIIALNDPELHIETPRFISRGEPLRHYLQQGVLQHLFIANPGGLHCATLIEALEAGFGGVSLEKPVCVSAPELERLRAVSHPVAVYHGYRVAWGPRTIRRLIDEGALGEVFSVECRYWQSSAAKAFLGMGAAKSSWKDDPAIGGPHDALTDLGSHVTDMILFLMGARPQTAHGWVGARCASAPHRDTHVQLRLGFSGDRTALASISKVAHGSTNHFEITVLGTHGSVSWNFLNPDELIRGTGNQTAIMRREQQNPSSNSYAFHGLGWLEGYVYITHQALRHTAGLSYEATPMLGEALDALEPLFNLERLD